MAHDAPRSSAPESPSPLVGYPDIVGTAPDDPRRGDLINALMDRGRWMEADRLAAAWLVARPSEAGPLLVRALCATRRFDLPAAAEHCVALKRTGAAAAILLGTIAAQLTFGQEGALTNARRALELVPADDWDDELQDVCLQAAVTARDADLLRRTLDRAAPTSSPIPVGRMVINGALEILRRELLLTLAARRDDLAP